MADAEPEYLLGGQARAIVLIPVAASMRRRRSSRGFTLVELAVTVTLLVILVSVGIPSFMTWIRNTQVRSVAESLQTGLRQAQTDALRLNRSVVFYLTNGTPSPAAIVPAAANGKSWAIERIAQFDDLTTSQARFVTGGSLTDVASKVTITSATISICFNANGRISTNAAPGVVGAVCNAGPARFDIAQPNVDLTADRSLSVLVAIGGQIHMCDPNRPALSVTSPDGCP